MRVFPIFITEQNSDRTNMLNLQISWINFFRAQKNLYCSLTDRNVPNSNDWPIFRQRTLAQRGFEVR